MPTLAGLRASDEPIRWLFTGDSVTHGSAHTHGERDYVQLFEERLRAESGRLRDHVIRTAVSGRTIVDIELDLDWSVLSYRPDIVSIMIGLNDSRDGELPVDDFAATYRRVLARIADSGAVLILHTPNRIRQGDVGMYPFLSEIVLRVRELADEFGALLVDHHSSWQDAEESGLTAGWLGQTCHPNAYGHRALARVLISRAGLWDPASATCRLTFPAEAALVLPEGGDVA